MCGNSKSNCVFERGVNLLPHIFCVWKIFLLPPIMTKNNKKRFFVMSEDFFEEKYGHIEKILIFFTKRIDKFG